MWSLIIQNRYFFIGASLFLCIGLTLAFTLEQGAGILWFSDHRTTAGNLFFKFGTQLGEELIWYSTILIFLVLKPRHGLFLLTTALIVLTLTYVLKSYFSHPRPYLYFQMAKGLDKINFVEGIRLLKGSTSFPSGHTLSAFAAYTGLALILKDKKIGNIICLFIAVVVGISRVYLVQHFIKDIVLGAFLGIAISLLIFHLFGQLSADRFPWLDKRPFARKKGEVIRS